MIEKMRLGPCTVTLVGHCWVVESDEGVGNFLEGFSAGGFSHPHDLAYRVGQEV